MSGAEATDEIVLRVPASPSYGRVVRIGAAALALRQGLSFTEIDDIRLAIDESMILLLEGADDDCQVDCVFRIVGRTFELEATRPGSVLTQEAVNRFDELAADLLDDYDVDPSRGWLRIRKRSAETNDGV